MPPTGTDAVEHSMLARYTRKLLKEKEALQTALDEAMEQVAELQARESAHQQEQERQQQPQNTLSPPAASVQGSRSSSPAPGIPREDLSRHVEEKKEVLRRLSRQNDEITLALRLLQERTTAGEEASRNGSRSSSPSPEELKKVCEMQQLGREQDFAMFAAQVEIAVAEWAQQASEPELAAAASGTPASSSSGARRDSTVELMEKVQEHCQELLTKVNDTAMFSAEVQNSVQGLKKQTLATVAQLRSNETLCKDPSLQEYVTNLEDQAKAQADVFKRLASMFLSKRGMAKLDAARKENLDRILPLLKLDSGFDAPPVAAAPVEVVAVGVPATTPRAAPVPPAGPPPGTSCGRKPGRTFPMNDAGKGDLPSISGISAQPVACDPRDSATPMPVGKPMAAKGQLRKARFGPVKKHPYHAADAPSLENIELGGTLWARGVSAPPECGFELSPLPGEESGSHSSQRTPSSSSSSRRVNLLRGSTQPVSSFAEAPAMCIGGAGVERHTSKSSVDSGCHPRTPAAQRRTPSSKGARPGSSDSRGSAFVDAGEVLSPRQSASPTRGHRTAGEEVPRMQSKGLSARSITNHVGVPGGEGDAGDATDLPVLKAKAQVSKRSSNPFALLGGPGAAPAESPRATPAEPTPRATPRSSSNGRAGAGGHLPDIELPKVVGRVATGR